MAGRKSYKEDEKTEDPPMIEVEEEDVGARIAGAAKAFDQPNISTRGMIMDAAFWNAIVKAMKG